ncbi:uncharacterized protein [Mycetomoellerius zeteki]|uniref:uncharacterized protein n=1 Tax=Mycetomoellerius zeteki TaxID=64791 RepID=UPI00084EA543|nr:PREDICTED: uncharacterized protein LOC108730190 [Trachymyrmex zeteki]
MDNACFTWALVSALYPTNSHAHRLSQYPHYSDVLLLEGIEFPVILKQITKFKRLNDISINVFTERERDGKKDDNIIVPLRLTKDKREKHVNLLYLQDSRRGENVTGHFTWIKNLSRLIGSQLSKNTKKKYLCDRCLHYFHTSEKLSLHVVDCATTNDCAIILPNEDDKWLSNETVIITKRSDFPLWFTPIWSVYWRRRPAMKICRGSPINITGFSASRRGEDCVSWFVNELYDLAHRAKTIFNKNVTMTGLTSDEWEKFRDAPHCHICERPFEEGDLRVRDHCHLIGRYRGPAHSHCNLNYRESYVIPVFFHNLSGYDAHFIIKDIANSFEGSVYLLTKENYISFTKYVKDTAKVKWGMDNVKLRFVDSFKFLSTSFEKLVSYLDKSKLTITRSEFRNLNTEDFDLLARKGAFPYEYVNSVDKLDETSLPPRESFYSSLTDEVVSEDDYQYATNIWRRFCIKTLGDYSDFYGLDPTYYYTLLGYTWDAMLKYTGIRFELLTEIDMVMFVERGIRGGLSQGSHRYVRANNKYAPSYDPSEPSTYLMYFDVNNLYGWAMSESLPYGEFR